MATLNERLGIEENKTTKSKKDRYNLEDRFSVKATPMTQRSLTSSDAKPLSSFDKIANQYKEYADFRKDEVIPKPIVPVTNPRFLREPQIESNGSFKDVEAALVSGAGQANIGTVNALRTLNAPVSYLGSKLDELFTGKKVEPFKDPLSRGLGKVVEQQEKAVAPYQERVSSLTGPMKYLGGAIQSIPQIAPAFLGATSPQLLGSIGAQAFGSQAREAEKQGANIGQQFASGLASAGTEIATEALPISNLTKLIGSKGTFKTVLTNVLEEFGGESLAQAMNPFIESAYKNNAVKDAYTTNLKQTLQEIIDSGITGATAGFIVGGASMGINIDLSTPEKAQETVANIEQTMAQNNIRIPQIDRQALSKFYQEQAQLKEPLLQAEFNPNLEAFQREQAIKQRQSEEAGTNQFQPLENPNFELPKAEPVQQPTQPSEDIFAQYGLPKPTQDVFAEYGLPQPTQTVDEVAKQEIYYHGSPVAFDKISQENTGGLINLTSKYNTALKYASGGGGSRAFINDMNKYVVDYDGNVYAKTSENSDFEYIGYDNSNGDGKIDVVKTDKKLPPLTEDDINKGIENAELFTANKNPNVVEVSPKNLNTLDLTKDGGEGVKVLASLNSNKNRNVANIIQQAKDGYFDWGSTKFEASQKIWQDIINPQLKKLGYNSIKFNDDNGPNNPTIAMFNESDLNYKNQLTEQPTTQADTITPPTQKTAPIAPQTTQTPILPKVKAKETVKPNIEPLLKPKVETTEDITPIITNNNKITSMKDMLNTRYDLVEKRFDITNPIGQLKNEANTLKENRRIDEYNKVVKKLEPLYNKLAKFDKANNIDIKESKLEFIKETVKPVVPKIPKVMKTISKADIDKVTTKEEAVKTLKALEAQNKRMPMNLQLFSEMKDALNAIIKKADAEYKKLGGKTKPLSFPQGRVTDLNEYAQKIFDANPATYKEIHNVDTDVKAKEIMKKFPKASKELLSSEDNYNNALESVVGMNVIQETFKKALTDDSYYDEAFRMQREHAIKLEKSGQIIQAAAMWARTTPEGMVKHLDNIIKDAKKRGYKVTVDDTLKKQIYEDMTAIQGMTDVKGAVDYINKLQNDRVDKDLSKAVTKNLSDRDVADLQEIATSQVLNKIMDTVDISFWQKVSTYQAMAHLLNTKTASRNILSNATTNEAERFSNVLGIPIDLFISKNTGIRSVTVPQALYKGLKQANQMASDASTRIQLGLSVEGNKYDTAQTFQEKPNAKLIPRAIAKGASTVEKALRYELQVTDQWQKGFIQSDIGDQFNRINNGKPLSAEQDTAVQGEMKFRTFQDDTLASKFLTMQKDNLNRIGFGKQKKGTSVEINGKQFFGVREFGLGDFVLKYSKVPGNIITRKIEYSPIGYIKALHDLTLIKNSNTPVLAQRKAVMALGRATSGTMMVGMGALLKSLGLIIREDDDEAKGLKALKKAAGLGNYKFNLSGASRLLSGGDPNLQEGDTLVTYGWIEPIGSSFTVGASIYDAVANKQNVAEISLSALNQTMEESLDISTLGIIKSMTYGQTPLEVMSIPFASGISGFVPSVVRQTAGVVDPVMRNKYSGTPFKKATKQIKGAIPFMSKSLEPYLSPTGEERTNNTNIIGNIISQLSPATVTTYQPQKILEPLLRLDIKTDIPIPYPTASAPATLSLNNEEVSLTDEQKTIYMAAKGKYTAEGYQKALDGKDIENMSESDINTLIARLNSIKSQSVIEGKKVLERTLN